MSTEDKNGDQAVESTGDPETGSLRPKRRRWPWLLGTLAVVGGIAAGVWWFGGGDATTEATTAPQTMNTAEVIVTDLIESEDHEGTLGYVAGDPVLSRLTGTVTALPEAGATLGEGDVLYWVDDEPVFLLFGETPAYRLLRQDDEGADVLQLEEALVRLGYDPDEEITVDEEFTWRTENMVEDWQEDAGLDDSGEVELGRVIFLPEPIRVGETLLNVGDPVGNGNPVLATSSEVTLVAMELDTADQGKVEQGDAVVVELPDGTEVAGTTTVVGSVAKARADGTSYFEVEIVLVDDAAAEGLDEAPVTIRIVTDRAGNVTAVPVAALVALAEGGYAVEVDNGDGTTRLVAVDAGMYADGFVEVTAAAITGGTIVVVP